MKRASVIIESLTEEALHPQLDTIQAAVNELAGKSDVQTARLWRFDDDATPEPIVTYRRPPSPVGFHMSIGPHGDFMNIITDCANHGRAISGAKVFKDGGGDETRAASDRSYVVFRSDARYHFPNGRWDDLADNPPYDYTWDSAQTNTIARGWMDGCWEMWRYNPAHFYELVNEPNPATTLQMQNLIDFSRACMDIAEQQYNVKLAIGGFSSGTPSEEFIEMMSPLLADMAARGHILSLHDGAAAPDVVLFKDAYNGGAALRWRLWEGIQETAGLAMPYYYSTETYCPEFYREYNKPERQDDMRWYFGECANDAKLLGTALFELGDYNFGGGSVNLASALPTIQDIILSLPVIE